MGGELNMNLYMKKTVVLGIVFLFLIMMLVPSLTANQQQKMIREEKTSFSQDHLEHLMHNAPQKIQNDLVSIIGALLREKNNFEDLQDIIDWLKNRADNPFISVILSRLLNLDRFKGKDLILSAGWNYDLNPFKKVNIKIMKPLTLWMYTDASNEAKFSSMSIVISMDPFNIEQVFGNQFGYMVRFRGFYGHMPQQYPKKSFTYMIGMAQNVLAVELPDFDLFAQ